MTDATTIQFDLTPPSEEELLGPSQISATRSGMSCSSTGPKPRFAASSSMRSARASTPAACADCRYSRPGRSSTAARDGRVLPRLSPRTISAPSATPVTAWSGSKSSAPAAARIKGMSSPTARRRLASATASIRFRWHSPRKVIRSPISLSGAPPKESHWPRRPAVVRQPACAAASPPGGGHRPCLRATG